MDQEALVAENDETFDPDLEIRDYEALGRALPVFCVSARAYQNLCGRFKNDKFQAHGFAHKEATEIPRLREHAQTLSSAARVSQCRRFFGELAQIVTSMRIWTAPQPAGQRLAISEQQGIQDLLDKRTTQLRQVYLPSLDQSLF